MSAEVLQTAKRAFRETRWELSRLWLWAHPEVDIVGITGSVGKTTVKEIVAGILAEQFPTLKTKANLDPIFNIPLTVLRIRGSEKLVAEMGVDGIGQMSKYLTLIRPRIGIITRFSAVHLDLNHFGSLATMIHEKSLLIKSLPPFGWAVLNGDDTNVRQLARITTATPLLIGFNTDNDLTITNFHQQLVNGSIKSSFTLKYSFGSQTFENQLLGKDNAFNSAVGVAVGMIMGLEFDQIRSALAKVRPVEHRLETKKGKFGLVIDDTYNASPEAVRSAIDVLADFDEPTTLVLGNMLELGSFAQQAHFEAGKYAATKNITALAVIGENANDVVNGYLSNGGLKENILVAPEHSTIIDWLTKRKPSLILVKGSHGMKMNSIVDQIVSS